MSNLLADIETFLLNKGVVPILYRDYIPSVPDTVACVYEYSGHSPLPQISGAYRSVQFVTRDTSPTAARQKALDIYNALVTDTGKLDLTDQRWCMINLKQSPFKLKDDEESRVYYVFNVGVITYTD